jgi:hypothetical protein
VARRKRGLTCITTRFDQVDYRTAWGTAAAIDAPAIVGTDPRISCDRCGKDRMLNEAYTPQGDMQLNYIIAKMRHDGCGGRSGRAELLTGVEGVSSRPVRRIVLRSG